MVKDPVCGMMIDEKTAAGKSEYQGETYVLLRGGVQAAVRSEPAELRA